MAVNEPRHVALGQSLRFLPVRDSLARWPSRLISFVLTLPLFCYCSSPLLPFCDASNTTSWALVSVIFPVMSNKPHPRKGRGVSVLCRDGSILHLVRVHHDEGMQCSPRWIFDTRTLPTWGTTINLGTKQNHAPMYPICILK